MTAAVAGHVELVHFFSSNHSTTRIEKIEANELLGATFLDKKHDLTNAIYFWKKALQLRSVILYSILNYSTMILLASFFFFFWLVIVYKCVTAMVANFKVNHYYSSMCNHYYLAASLPKLSGTGRLKLNDICLDSV